MPLSRFAEHHLSIGSDQYVIYTPHELPGARHIPVVLRVLAENVLRCVSDPERAQAMALAIVQAGLNKQAGSEIEFMPSRVLYQDFTGVPVFVDFAAMRDAAAERGGDPKRVNPRIPCTLVIDHSVTADVVSCSSAACENGRIEAERNAERFAFLKWSSQHFDQVTIVPPGVGICHQLNIERFCQIAMEGPSHTAGKALGFDTLVGTDSHTPTANGVGVLGWGVGGIEAEAAALGQAISMLVPQVIGVKLTGKLSGSASAMDVALTFAERLRARGVVGCFIECFGEGLATLSATQRATIANMTPEYGATATFFPADEAVLAQLELSGRTPEQIERTRAYLEAQELLNLSLTEDMYAEVIEIDLSEIRPVLAGPSRPHNRVDIANLKERFEGVAKEHGRTLGESFTVSFNETNYAITHGALAIAAITSCTTATDPAMMIAAGLCAQRACELGAQSVPWVKKVLAPGSHATTDLLARAGLLSSLEQLGFSICGYGCMSCIGNSGSIFESLRTHAQQCELASVLSGNRNFDGRINPDVAQNYLAAPSLVIAYSLAGTIAINLEEEPVCMGTNGPVYLSQLLPTDDEVISVLRDVLDRDLYEVAAHRAMEGDASWQALEVAAGDTFSWDAQSSYVRRPSYFEDATPQTEIQLHDARALVVLGDFVTTDHISPAGAISVDSPAAAYLSAQGIAPEHFNSYGSRRGNHEVMMRGTFANVRLENYLAKGKQGGYTYNHLRNEITSIFEAAEDLRHAGVAEIILAGKMYGSGSSRDWAAKGPALLGVKVVIAESFERIHRSNLIGMGILPLEFLPGDTVDTLGLTGHEFFSMEPLNLVDAAQQVVYVQMYARSSEGLLTQFTCRVRIDTPTEAQYLAAGGILPFVLDACMSSQVQ
ncbi:aconitate hydratase AcnA [Collinsella sp. zg1085]|uniref:aconitate hydratase AcnA n=1 Tax=Collinsella sp. zg1085 TaxID=2844380 RepID=UPI001C0E098E|nr:aconitate hydratase AcnA [Collinsella sp. zg1085]QWT17066.1 aconitate hydratase AcnA [Collinsella sp. zg1085]